MPYVVPVNFGYKDDCLYIHSSLQGLKMDILRVNANVCFEIDVDLELVPAREAVRSDPAVPQRDRIGTAAIVEDPRKSARPSTLSWTTMAACRKTRTPNRSSRRWESYGSTSRA